MSSKELKIRAVSQEEVNQIPWLTHRRKKLPPHHHPLEDLVDKLLTEITTSETGVACIEFGMLTSSFNELSLSNQLRFIAREKRGEQLETRLIREGVSNLGGRRSYANSRYTHMYVRRFPL